MNLRRLALLLVPDLRSVVRQVTEAERLLTSVRWRVDLLASTGSMVEVRDALADAIGLLDEVLDDLTGRGNLSGSNDHEGDRP